DRVPAEGADVRALLADRAQGEDVATATAGLPRRDPLAPPSPLRQRAAAPAAARRQHRARRPAGGGGLRPRPRPPGRLPRARRPRRSAALLRARHLGDGGGAVELPAPRRSGDVGPGGRDTLT